ncbi:MAG: hypothetical protein IT260_03865 [Saprospiraceae bacterium]|nr:hypothetical protein [Saprospiraceae bacterium]
MHLKQTDPELETIRERIILLLSILCGMLIAASFQQQIIDAIKGLKPNAESNVPATLVVFGFSLLFSFGSKFWHDMLDLLLFSKNVRRRWGDVDLEQLESAAQFSAYLQTTDPQQVRLAIQQNEAWLRRDNPNIRIITPGYELIDGAYAHCAVIYLIDDNRKNLPPSLPLTGSKTPVRIKVIDKLGKIQAQGQPGKRVLDKKARTFGTYGCLVERPEAGAHYVLTCAHVVTDRHCQFDEPAVKTRKYTIEPDVQAPAAEIALGDGFDCVLLGPVSPQDQENTLYRSMSLLPERILTETDAANQISVSLRLNRHNGIREYTGRLVQHAATQPVEVEYDDGLLSFSEMIVVESVSAIGPLTQSGDSGAVLYDAEGHALGLVVGADNTFTYALPIKLVLDKLNVQIPS